MKPKLTTLIIILTSLLITNYYLLITNFQALSGPSITPTISRFPFPKSESITLIATGDVMLGRAVNTRIRQHKDFKYPFLKTADLLKSADLTIINLEAPFLENCPLTNEGLIFCANPKSVEGLSFSGVDITNLANNHILNYGRLGLEQTIQTLRENQIHPIGTILFDDNTDRIIKIKDTKFGFLGFNLLDKYNEKELINHIKNLKRQVNILIVMLHWGIEYQKEPTKNQVNLAHQIINEGADLIIGTHPHVVQPYEEYKGKLIVYSLGNFVFDQPWSEETKKGMVAKLTFQDKKLVQKEFKTIYIPNTYQPELVLE